MGFATSSWSQFFHQVYPLDGNRTQFNAIHIDSNQFWITGSYMKTNGGSFCGMMLHLDQYGNELSLDTFRLNTEHIYLGRSHSPLFKHNDTTYGTYFSSGIPNGLPKGTFAIFNRYGHYDTLVIDSSFSTTGYHGIGTYTNSHCLRDSSNGALYIAGSGSKYVNGNFQCNGYYLSKYDNNLNLVWQKPFFYNDGRTYLVNDLFPKNQNFELVFSELYFGALYTQRTSKAHFLEFNATGTLIQDRVFQPSTFTQLNSGTKRLNDGKYIVAFTDSKMDTFAGNYTRIIRPYVGVLDPSLNLLWKDSLTQYWWTASDGISLFGFAPYDFLVQDSNFTYAYTRPLGLNVSDTIPFTSLLVQNRKLSNGSINWSRSYQFYDSASFTNIIPHYEIYDGAITPWDSGYVFVGTSSNFDSIQAGLPGILGYVLKTNCLGHMSDPVASGSFNLLDSMAVHFQSSCLQDGGVTWHFGDSSSQFYSEYQDSIFHQYATHGLKNVMLVAHGCGGRNDTLRFTVNVPRYTGPNDEPDEPVQPSIAYTKTIVIAPNPTIPGKPVSIYLGDIPVGGVNLIVKDQKGREVQKFFFPAGQTSYLIPLNLAAGIYDLCLYSKGKFLEHERLVVR